MKYRSRQEIVPLILEISQSGETKTKIMYRAYLSHSQTTEYLAMLIKNGLLNYDGMKSRYYTTKKGLTYLSYNLKLNELAEAKI